MKNRRGLVAGVTWLLALCPLFAQDAPSVSELIRSLGSDDVDERERAEKALSESGELTRPDLEKALAGEPGKDPEVASRLKSAIAGIELRIDWEELRVKSPEALALRITRHDVCPTCGKGSPWKAAVISNDQTAALLPGLKIVVLGWNCCPGPLHEVPVTRVFGIGTKAGEIPELSNGGARSELAKYLPAALTKKDREACASLIWTLVGNTGGTALPHEWKESAMNGAGFELELNDPEVGRALFWPKPTFEFDGQGRLVEFDLDRRKK